MRAIILGLMVLLALSVGLNVYWYFNPKEKKIQGETVFLPSGEKTIVYKLPEGNQAARTKVHQEYEEKSERAKELIATVKSIPDLEKEKQITSITTVIAKLELALNEKDMILNDKEKQLKEWKDKFNSVKIDNSTNKVDVNSEVSPKIATTEKRDHWYTPKIPYTTVTSENPSIKFYGLESYTFKNPKQKDFLELNLKVQGLYLQNQLIPYGGAELQFNPDGRVKPILGYGYYYDNLTGKLLPFWMGGVQFNLIRL